MPEKHKKLIQRWGHHAAAVTVNCDGVEVIIFGGHNNLVGSHIADTVVLRFGKCSWVMINNIFIVYSKHNPQITVLLMVNMYLLHETSRDNV